MITSVLAAATIALIVVVSFVAPLWITGGGQLNTREIRILSTGAWPLAFIAGTAAATEWRFRRARTVGAR